MESLVVTVIGKDRPGLVESVSAVVEEHGGSWVESRMSRLAGEFAGILRVSVPADRADGLTKALELVGSDRPGIVHKISEALAARGVNVDELNTECEGAPWSGGTLFKAMARLRAPKALDLDQLRESLEAIAGDLMVDISIGEAD